MERRVDVLVVGSGSAGTSVALAARSRGRSVALVDERPFGGTCALRGCDPKKVLVHAARVVDETRRLAERGILTAPAQLRWSELMRFKRTFTDPVPEQRMHDYAEAGVTALHGHARFEDEETIAVGDDRYRAERIVIASGAKERHVADGDEALLTSTAFLDIEEFPQSLIFAGGGYIAFEFAHVAARAGARVTILHNDLHPLSGFDRDAVERLLAESREIGIDVQLGAPVVRVEREGGGIAVHAGGDAGPRTFRAQAGVLAAGRAPDLDELELERGGVERTKKGVKVDEYLRSVSNARVYAAGDAADAGALPLTPAASYTGSIAAQNLLDGNVRKTDFHALPTMVYTIPPLGAVGMTETQAREGGIGVDVRAGDMTQWYSTRHVAGRSAFYKTIVEKRSGKLLGATVFGPHAEEQINVLALAIRHGIGADAIADTFFAYPTGSSDIDYMISP